MFKIGNCLWDTFCHVYRIVVGGDILKYIPKWSAKVFRFDIEYGLTKEETQNVSDHFPVEFQFLSELHSVVFLW